MAGVEPWVSGCWRRESIAYRDGVVDRVTQVVWVQSVRYCGDIRIPEGRIAPASAQASLSQCHMTGDSAVWERELAFHPKRHFPEPGLLSLDGDRMIERAPSGAYEEVWLRQPGSEGVRAAYRLTGAARQGRLVIAGDHLYRAIDRSIALAGDATLEEMLTAGGDPASLFDCEFSYARRAHGGAPHVIQMSTLSHLEGVALDGYAALDFTATELRASSDPEGWIWVRLDDSRD